MSPRNPFIRQQKDVKGDSRVFIGAHIPVKVFQDLSANALYSGQSRSAIIEHAVELFLRNYAKAEQDIVYRISRRAVAEWDSFRAMSIGKKGWNERLAFNKYRESLIRILKKKGIAEQTINKVMERIR